jgi:hypothetical protein
MASRSPNARASRISFVTDMTRPDAPELLLGYLLEAVWPEQARWLGLIGRTRLIPSELALINLKTWPELEKPFGLLDRTFDESWEGSWGEAGATAQRLWTRSPLTVRGEQHDELLIEAEIDSDSAWTKTTDMLSSHLTLLGEKLRPLTFAFGNTNWTPGQLPPRAWSPDRASPRGRRMQEDFANAA